MPGAPTDPNRLEDGSPRATDAAERSEIETLLRFNEVVAGILAHDLKNPLAAVLMNARLLSSTDSERTRKLSARIVTSGERMARMIDQILEWTQVRARTGSLALTRTDCDLGAITDDAVTELRAHRADAPIAVERRGDLGGRWDADRLAQVVSNLIANALEHATSPGVLVTLEGDDRDEVRLAVRNEGRIADDVLPLIFEPFRGRAQGAAARGRGLGLGLYLTRQILLAHGGRVAVEREPDGRVTFVATLPRALA